MSKWARRRAVRPIRDFLLILGLFALVASFTPLGTGTTGNGLFLNSAQARVLEYPPEPPAIVVERQAMPIAAAKPARTPVRHEIMVAILGLALATLGTLNLMFARHLCRVAARSRRRVRRMGAHMRGRTLPPGR
jgi:hypothetical protein